MELIISRLDAQDEVLKRIESKVDKTNGRVTALELWRHGLQVLADKISTRRAVVIGLLSGTTIAIIGAVATVLMTLALT